MTPRLDVVGDVSAGDWNMFDARANYIAVSYRDDMRDAVASINNSAGERSLLDHLGGPGGSEGEHRLLPGGQ